jgi:hypothetical protein
MESEHEEETIAGFLPGLEAVAAAAGARRDDNNNNIF